MKGIVPPSPMYIAGLPKNSRLEASIACSSQGDIAGAFQPVLAFSSSRLTCAPLGASFSSRSFSNWPASLPSRVGGRRNDSFTEV